MEPRGAFRHDRGDVLARAHRIVEDAIVLLHRDARRRDRIPPDEPHPGDEARREHQRRRRDDDDVGEEVGLRGRRVAVDDDARAEIDGEAGRHDPVRRRSERECDDEPDDGDGRQGPAANPHAHRL